MADTKVRYTDVSTPNVWAFQWVERVEPDRPLEYTVFKAVPGDTWPRVQVRDLESPEPYDWGQIVQPTRFGSWGTTKEEFKAWVERFRTNQQES